MRTVLTRPPRAGPRYVLGLATRPVEPGFFNLCTAADLAAAILPFADAATAGAALAVALRADAYGLALAALRGAGYLPDAHALNLTGTLAGRGYWAVVVYPPSAGAVVRRTWAATKAGRPSGPPVVYYGSAGVAGVSLTDPRVARLDFETAREAAAGVFLMAEVAAI